MCVPAGTFEAKATVLEMEAPQSYVNPPEPLVEVTVAVPSLKPKHVSSVNVNPVMVIPSADAGIVIAVSLLQPAPVS